MLYNVESRDSLRGLARLRARKHETMTVPSALAEEHVARRWTIDQTNRGSVRLRRDKALNVLLEDTVWSLLFQMGFNHLSGKGGATLLLNPKEPDGAKSQVDVVGIEDDVAVAIECKSAENYGRRAQFQEELGKHALIRRAFSSAVNAQWGTGHKRTAVLAMFLSNVLLSDNDRQRAEEANVVLFDETDLKYYRTLVAEVGPAAKYQFLSDMLPDKDIPGLRIRVPAVRAKMGGFNCYSFCVSPEYLLKISFVSHRAKGKGSDVTTYQRMLRKSRLNRIREYIAKDGIFPTNIVVNMDRTHLRFERIHQGDDDHIVGGSGTLGWLDIRPSYKSAWIIDGQHRLFAYSGHKDSKKSLLSVLAFEGLPEKRQAQLFIDINSKQKAVKRNLLEELYAALHEQAKDPKDQVKSIVSQVIQDLNSDRDSPFYGRIQEADDPKSPVQCITLAALYGAINKKGFHIAREKHGQVLEYGPLWAGDREATLKRTAYVLKAWFNVIRRKAEDWWDKGSGEGGGLAMNDSAIACIDVLRSVFHHLDSSGCKLVEVDRNDELFSYVQKYADAVAEYLSSLSEDKRKEYRDFRGVQGQTARARRCQKAIRDRFPDFNPPGLQEYLDLEKAQTNRRAKETIDNVEAMVQRIIIGGLRRKYPGDENQWWLSGVPKNVRTAVSDKYEEDDGKRGGKEYYFDLIHYKKIAMDNWDVFEPLLAYGNKGNKDVRTSWLDFLNEQRKIVSHKSSGATVTFDALNQLHEYEKWLFDSSRTDLPG